MITENQGYIIDVIAELQKRLASETASNKYLRGELERKDDELNVLGKKYAQQHKLLDEYAAKETEMGDVLKSLNNQIAEQKETIETLQSSLKNLDAKYISLKFDFNNLQDENNGK
jgi:chromosome segregation ATPase